MKFKFISLSISMFWFNVLLCRLGWVFWSIMATCCMRISTSSPFSLVWMVNGSLVVWNTCTQQIRVLRVNYLVCVDTILLKATTTRRKKDGKNKRRPSIRVRHQLFFCNFAIQDSKKGKFTFHGMKMANSRSWPHPNSRFTTSLGRRGARLG